MHYALLLDQSPPWNRPRHTPPERPQNQATLATLARHVVPSYKTSCKMEQAMSNGGHHPRHHTPNNMQASFYPFVTLLSTFMQLHH